MITYIYCFLLAIFFAPSVIGLYALGIRIIRLPMMLVGDAVTNVFLQKSSEIREKKAVLGEETIKLISYLS